MIIIICFILALGYWLFVPFRLFFEHPLASFGYFFKDSFYFFKYKKWRLCKTGELVAYCGLFGQGKTLSAVHTVTQKYYKYNDKMVFCPDRKKWVTQKIIVISNVKLSIPYIDFVSLQQLVDYSNKIKDIDYENDTLSCLIVLGDEFSTQLNSRNFKTNFSPVTLNVLLTCRHFHMSIFYTSQRFSHCDALLRQVTSYVVQCNKNWRFMVHKYYDAWTLENSNNPEIIKPLKRTGFFIFDRDFNAYDTLATVGNLIKSAESGDMLSDQDIINLQGNNGNIESISDTRFRRSFRQKKQKNKTS